MEDHNLVKNTLDQIPQANANAKRIVGLVKEGDRITGVGIAHRGDTEYLKSIPDGSENNNLGNLPSVSPDTQG
ncbi:MAG: DUF3892 domain-containing protein [Oscillospiraceae bacterium]|nr:DUF3892 domain-containing protein [Oscillospiraceae bacterium]